MWFPTRDKRKSTVRCWRPWRDWLSDDFGAGVSALRPRVGKLAGGFTDDPIVIGVRADPAPQYATFYLFADGTVTKAHADGPVLAGLVEVERWMSGI